MALNRDLCCSQAGKVETERLGTVVSFPDAMRFRGAAPELINSRLAMLGVIAGFVAEKVTGETVFEQVRSCLCTSSPVVGQLVAPSQPAMWTGGAGRIGNCWQYCLSIHRLQNCSAGMLCIRKA